MPFRNDVWLLPPPSSLGLKLDKIRRGTLSQMNDQQRLLIFLPLVQQRASDMGLLPTVAKIVELHEAEVVDPQVTPTVSRPMRQLEKFAAHMPLIQLIGCCMHEIPDTVQNALTQVRSQLAPPQVVAGRRGPSVLL